MKKESPHYLLLGMATRRKLLYVPGGCLYDAITLEKIRSWTPRAETLDASEYCVTIETDKDRQVRIFEDEEAVWIEEDGNREPVTKGKPVRLPRFEGHPHAGLLRALHAELLVNLMPFGPVPNLWVYPRPWYRDAAMMLMCFKHTGNVHLLEPWVMGLDKAWDRNNAGNSESDTLGQILYMVSLFDAHKHPLVEEVLKAVPRCLQDGHLVGRTDHAEHPVYQTKWLKVGLKALGLDDPYEIPAVEDSYSSLFWMDYRDSHVPGPRFPERAVQKYPYLGWAEAHFYDEPPPLPVDEKATPLTWEGSASEARYWRLRPLVEIGAVPESYSRRMCMPHTWHAAEMFLYYVG